MNSGNELYNYSKFVFDEELSRYHRIHGKAGLLITAVTSILTVYSVVLASSYFDQIMEVGGAITLVLGILVLIGFLLSFILAFLSLRDGELNVPPLNEEVISLFKENDIDQVFYAISEEYQESVEHNRRVTDYKMRLLTYSYRSILITVLLFVANMFWFLIALAQSKGELA